MVQRPVGQSVTARRPSSKAAVSWAARAGPTPGTRSSSRGEAAARPVTPSQADERTLSHGRDRGAPGARCPQQADELRRRQAGCATGDQPLPRSLRCGQLLHRWPRRCGTSGCHGWSPSGGRRGEVLDAGASGSGRRSPPIPPPSGPEGTADCRERPLASASFGLRCRYEDDQSPAGSGILLARKASTSSTSCTRCGR